MDLSFDCISLNFDILWANVSLRGSLGIEDQADNEAVETQDFSKNENEDLIAKKMRKDRKSTFRYKSRVTDFPSFLEYKYSPCRQTSLVAVPSP